MPHGVAPTNLSGAQPAEAGTALISVPPSPRRGGSPPQRRGEVRSLPSHRPLRIYHARPIEPILLRIPLAARGVALCARSGEARIGIRVLRRAGARRGGAKQDPLDARRTHSQAAWVP